MNRLLLTLLVIAFCVACGGGSSAPKAAPSPAPIVATTAVAPKATHSPSGKSVIKNAFSPVEVQLGCSSVDIAVHALKAHDGEAATISGALRTADKSFKQVVGSNPYTPTFITQVEAAEFAPSGSIPTLSGIVKICKQHLHYKAF